MGASDNLAAGLSGLAGGVSDVLGYYIKKKIDSNESDVPIEQVEALTGKSFPNIPRGTMIGKENLQYLLSRQETPGTTVIDRVTGKSTVYPNTKVEFTPASTMYQPTDQQGNPIGEPTANRPVVIKPPVEKKPDPNKMTLQELKNSGVSIPANWDRPEFLDYTRDQMKQFEAQDARARLKYNDHNVFTKMIRSSPDYIIPPIESGTSPTPTLANPKRKPLDSFYTGK